MKQIIKEFTTPSVAYRGKPFWAWNGELRGEELVRQAKIMKEMGFGGYFMHSRAGLITEYLGEEWFDLINEVADAAERDGMEAWLYDEDRWPSGSAGGKVTIDPQYRMKSLRVYEMSPEKYSAQDGDTALFIAKIDGINLWCYRELERENADIYQAIEKAEAACSPEEKNAPGEWKVLRFTVEAEACNSNYNGTTYADTMSRKATERFIEITHEEYLRHCGDRLGKSIKGIFTDEPHRGHCLDDLKDEDGVRSCSMCWTEDLFDEFVKRYGYDPRPILPELYYRFRGEKAARVKLNYIDLANNLFIERFAVPLYEWCKEHQLILTGHVLHEDSLMNQTICHGSLMRFYEHMEYPGVDCLGEYNRCYWIVKQLSSAARQLGKKWLLSELYGCTGWQFNFKSHKAVGDWHALFGINLRCQHLSWYTMEGEAKRDYPASILHQSPWYVEYSKVEDYFARFGVVITEGRPACDVLVINPIESVWCQAYIGWARWLYNNSDDIVPYEERYAQMFHMLDGNQIDFDYGEEQMMESMAFVDVDEEGKAVLHVGKQCYRTVLMGNMLTVRPSTLRLLEKFMKLGGTVIFAGEVPEYVDAVKSEWPRELSMGGVCIPFEEKAIVSAIREASEEYISVTDKNGDTERDVFVQVRKDFGGNGYAVVLLNTDRDCAKDGLTVKLNMPEGYRLQEWNMEDGTRKDAEKIAVYKNGALSIMTSLEAAGTRCFVLVSEETEQLREIEEYETVCELETPGEFRYSLKEENVCVLDFARWRWADGEYSSRKEILKVDQEVRDSIDLEHRGGEMLQPWFAKLHDHKQYGMLELEYEFDIENIPEGEVYLAGERPELNTYKINGVALAAETINDIWIDECFKKMRVPDGALRKGTNVVSVQVNFARTTNIEALYLIGSFGVDIQGHHCTLVKLPEKIGYSNLDEYQMPFYTGSITWHITPEQYPEQLNQLEGDRILLVPEGFTGGYAKVSAMGQDTVLGWDPYEADVTDAVRKHTPIDVTVVGTRRNLFGPLHQIPKLAKSYGPNSFVTTGEKWTDDYNLIDSGLRGIVWKIQNVSKKQTER